MRVVCGAVILMIGLAGGCLGEDSASPASSDTTDAPDGESAERPRSSRQPADSESGTTAEKARELKEADLALLKADLSAPRIPVGDAATLRFRVENTGEEDGSFAIQFLVDGEVHTEQTFRVLAGATEAGSFTFTPAKKGTYTLELTASVLGERGTSSVLSEPFRLEVFIPADLQVLSSSVSQREAEVGAPVTVTAAVANRGDEAGKRNVRLFFNGELYGTQEVTARGGETRQVEFSVVSDARGSYSLRVEDVEAGAVQFYVPATFEVMNLAVSTTSPAVEDEITGELQIRNTGDKGGSVQLRLVLGTDEIHNEPVYVGPQSSQRIAITEIHVRWTDTRTLQALLNDAVARELQITPRAPRLSIDAVSEPWNSDWSCWDTAQVVVRYSNLGAAADHDVALEFWVDGEQKMVAEPDSSEKSSPQWRIGNLAAGASGTTPKLDILDVLDECGVDDHHKLVVRLVGRYGGVIESEVISFVF